LGILNGRCCFSSAGGAWVPLPIHHRLWNHAFTHSPPSHWAQRLGGAWVTVPMHHRARKFFCVYIFLPLPFKHQKFSGGRFGYITPGSSLAFPW
jgi:hypothetical protein